MKEFKIKPVHQNSCRFRNNITYDRDYNGIATSQFDEGKRVASLINGFEGIYLIVFRN